VDQIIKKQRCLLVKVIISIVRIITAIADFILWRFNLLRKSKIADRLTEARVDEAGKVKADYAKKFKKKEAEYFIRLKEIKDNYNSELQSRVDFYERERALAEKEKVIALLAKDRDIDSCKSTISSMQRTYEDAKLRLKSMQLIMSELKAYMSKIEKRDMDEHQELKALDQRLSFIELNLPDSKVLEDDTLTDKEYSKIIADSAIAELENLQ